MREKTIEAKLVQTVRSMGGLALNFTSPGFDGVPDRLVLLPGGKFAAFATKKTDLQALHPNMDADPAGPFYGKTVVFTGDLSLTREAAAEAVSALGASVKSGVSKATDFLVVGRQDAALVGAKGHSSKELKAQQLNEQGKASITVLDEPAFLALLGQAEK